MDGLALAPLTKSNCRIQWSELRKERKQIGVQISDLWPLIYAGFHKPLDLLGDDIPSFD